MKTIVIEDKQRIESIILQADACFVGITDLEGNPYVVPMNFGYENDTLYLHSGPEGGKIEMLQLSNILRYYDNAEDIIADIEQALNA